MTIEGEEDQIQRFVKFKDDPDLFEREMIVAGLTDAQRQSMHEELDQYNGCAATQESFMVLSQKLAGYSLKQADALRKTVAKKKMSEIGAQKDLFYGNLKESGASIEVADYLWKVVIAPSLGYGFSLNHALPYSIIGVQCILMGGIHFGPIYWQTACLLQRSGALDGKTADYNKIAKAVSLLAKQGVDIRPVDINTSEKEFALDAQRNVIHYGLDGVKGLKSKVIEKIIEERPFSSMLDFMVRTSADITSTVTLVKAGAFDEFSSRMDNIEILARMKCGQKEELNGRNLAQISREGHWPQDTEELKMAQRVFNFTEYLKIITAERGKEEKEVYFLDERAMDFLDEIGYEHDGYSVPRKAWKYMFDIKMRPIKQYLIEHQQEMLEKLNERLIVEWKKKYFPNNDFAQWEIETMGLCFSDHPMRNVINVDRFDDLPQEPVVAYVYRTKTGRAIPMFDLTMICGIVIAKDKLHSSITLLTAEGPVEVKFRKEQFAHYDAQISQQVNGKKQVVEKSWLNRGNGLIIHGMRQDDLFMAKTYKNSPMEHTAYKITNILSTGKVEVQKDRKKGRAEESPDESES